MASLALTTLTSLPRPFDHTDKVNLPGFHHSSTIDEPKLVHLEPHFEPLRSGDLPYGHMVAKIRCSSERELSHQRCVHSLGGFEGVKV